MRAFIKLFFLIIAITILCVSCIPQPLTDASFTIYNVCYYNLYWRIRHVEDQTTPAVFNIMEPFYSAAVFVEDGEFVLDYEVHLHNKTEQGSFFLKDVMDIKWIMFSFKESKIKWEITYKD
ncbi:MAG: hypothetical protein IIV67_04835 [Bacteroidaceae bacterium]|nr:hypothetical protein [Bacteroidaceae bacterium]